MVHSAIQELKKVAKFGASSCTITLNPVSSECIPTFPREPAQKGGAEQEKQHNDESHDSPAQVVAVHAVMGTAQHRAAAASGRCPMKHFGQPHRSGAPHTGTRCRVMNSTTLRPISYPSNFFSLAIRRAGPSTGDVASGLERFRGILAAAAGRRIHQESQRVNRQRDHRQKREMPHIPRSARLRERRSLRSTARLRAERMNPPTRAATPMTSAGDTQAPWRFVLAAVSPEPRARRSPWRRPPRSESRPQTRQDQQRRYGRFPGLLRKSAPWP